MNEEVKKALAILLVILLVIPMYASAHDGGKEEKIKADDTHETEFNKDYDLKKADDSDFEDDVIKKQSDDGNKFSDKSGDEEKSESKHEKEERGADEKEGLNERVKRDFKDLVALAEKIIEKESPEDDKGGKEKSELTQKTEEEGEKKLGGKDETDERPGLEKEGRGLKKQPPEEDERLGGKDETSEEVETEESDKKIDAAQFHTKKDSGKEEKEEENKEEPEKEKIEKKGEKKDAPLQIDNQNPAKETAEQKEVDPTPDGNDQESLKISREQQPHQTQHISPDKNQKKDDEPVKDGIVEKIKRQTSPDSIGQNPGNDKPAGYDGGDSLENAGGGSVSNGAGKEGPDFPVDAMGAAGAMVISGIAMLSGAGTAASISPTITIPKAAAIEKSASFIAKTMSAVKTVFGEFLEDWAFTLQTRLNIPFISDRHRGRRSRHRPAAIFKEMDSIRYSFLNTEVSLLEFSKMFFCVLLMGAGFSLVQPSEIGTFMEIFPVAFFAVGTAIFSHEFAHDTVANRHGVDTRFEIWPLGVVVMLISISLGGVFAAFMNSEIKGKTEDHGVIYLAGPLTNFLLAVIFLMVSGLGGPMYLIGRLGAAVNITIAAYNLLPIKPVDGHYIFKWNKFWWTVLAVPCFVIAASALEGVVI